MSDRPERESHSAGVLPARYSPRIHAAFGWYVARLMRKKFFALRIRRGDEALLASLDGHPSPVVVAMNHPSWWDPITALVLARSFMPSRRGAAPMEREQLLRFAIFRRLGLFGIDPHDPHALATLLDHMRERFANDPRPLFWITAQGAFTDVREPFRPHAGAAAVAVLDEGTRMVAVMIEYAFWQDQRPEVFVAAEEVRPEQRTRTGWQRSLVTTAHRTAADLATKVEARDPEAFTALFGGEGAAIHPVYDWWLRLRGRHGAIEAANAGARETHDTREVHEPHADSSGPGANR